MHTVYLALGTNVGNRATNLKQAIAALPPQMEVKARSRIYETPPWGYVNQPVFYNQTAQVETYLDPLPLLKHLKRLEIALGRVPSFQNGPRSALLRKATERSMIEDRLQVTGARLSTGVRLS